MSSSSAAIRFFKLSYSCDGSTGGSGFFFLPFVPFVGVPLGLLGPPVAAVLLGGTGGAAVGAGGVGPVGGGFTRAVCLAPAALAFVLCVPFMTLFSSL
jgi:hypothetical protein